MLKNFYHSSTHGIQFEGTPTVSAVSLLYHDQPGCEWILHWGWYIVMHTEHASLLTKFTDSCLASVLIFTALVRRTMVQAGQNPIVSHGMIQAAHVFIV